VLCHTALFLKHDQALHVGENQSAEGANENSPARSAASAGNKEEAKQVPPGTADDFLRNWPQRFKLYPPRLSLRAEC
jgi:hypothetical protein